MAEWTERVRATIPRDAEIQVDGIAWNLGGVLHGMPVGASTLDEVNHAKRDSSIHPESLDEDLRLYARVCPEAA